VSVCLCVSVPCRIPTDLQCCPDPGITLGNGRGCPLVVHYWAYLQLMHRFYYYGNIHILIQYNRPMLQCKGVLIDVSAFGQLAVNFSENLCQARNVSECMYSLCGWLSVLMLFRCFTGLFCEYHEGQSSQLYEKSYSKMISILVVE